MKLNILSFGILLCSLAFSACSNESKTVDAEYVENPLTMEDPDALDNASLPEMEFETTFHDFGNVQEGEKVSYAFKFKNTGNANLIISNASGSCGCTVPEIPEEPVSPGETAFIKAVFDSKGRVGLQEKSITVISNAIPNSAMLRIKSMVIAKEE